MLSWLNLSNLQTCDLNDSIVNWLGVERESLSTDCDYKLQVSKGDSHLTSQSNKQQKSALSYKSTK